MLKTFLQILDFGQMTEEAIQLENLFIKQGTMYLALIMIKVYFKILMTANVHGNKSFKLILQQFKTL